MPSGRDSFRRNRVAPFVLFYFITLPARAVLTAYMHQLPSICKGIERLIAMPKLRHACSSLRVTARR
jgi:hypothetical protein